MRRERDSSSVLRDEEMREMAALSGAMLKFVIVWAMSWKRFQLRWLILERKKLTVAGSSSRSMAALVCMR